VCQSLLRIVSELIHKGPFGCHGLLFWLSISQDMYVPAGQVGRPTVVPGMPRWLGKLEPSEVRGANHCRKGSMYFLPLSCWLPRSVPSSHAEASLWQKRWFAKPACRWAVPAATKHTLVGAWPWTVRTRQCRSPLNLAHRAWWPIGHQPFHTHEIKCYNTPHLPGLLISLEFFFGQVIFFSKKKKVQ
jgi:hypothetical protein